MQDSLKREDEFKSSEYYRQSVLEVTEGIVNAYRAGLVAGIFNDGR